MSMSADAERAQLWRAIETTDNRITELAARFDEDSMPAQLDEIRSRVGKIESQFLGLERGVAENTLLTRAGLATINESAEVLKEVRETQIVRRRAWEKFKQGGIVVGIIAGCIGLYHQVFPGVHKP